MVKTVFYVSIKSVVIYYGVGATVCDEKLNVGPNVSAGIAAVGHGHGVCDHILMNTTILLIRRRVLYKCSYL